MSTTQPPCPRCEKPGLTKHCKSMWCRWQFCLSCRWIIGDDIAQRWIPGPGAGAV